MNKSVLAMVMMTLLVSKAVADEQALWPEFLKERGEPAMINTGLDFNSPSVGPYRALPDHEQLELDPDKRILGRELFHERALSGDGSIGCNSCHSGRRGGADGRPVALGVDDAKGDFNSPTVFNAAFHFRQFWDGRAETLAEQARGPVQNPIEMAHQWPDAVADLKAIDQYVTLFDAIYPDGVTEDNVVDAIAHFERGMITPDTDFNRYLRGDDEALSEIAWRGFEHFNDYGCVHCHNGISLGGNMYHRLGALEPYFSDERTAGPADEGLAARTGKAAYRHVFKVPGLHNVALTGPWLHDGSIDELSEVVRLMAWHQTGQEMPDAHVEAVVAFLESLSSDFLIERAEQRGGGGPPDVVLEEISTQPPTWPANRHEIEYARSLEEIEKAFVRLTRALKDIGQEKTTHYDALQFQHRELLRHARALQILPATINGEQRRELKGTAEQLLVEIQALEWLIADFLMEFSEHKLGAITATNTSQPSVLAPALDQLERSAIPELQSILLGQYSS